MTCRVTGHMNHDRNKSNDPTQFMIKLRLCVACIFVVLLRTSILVLSLVMHNLFAGGVGVQPTPYVRVTLDLRLQRRHELGKCSLDLRCQLWHDQFERLSFKRRLHRVATQCKRRRKARFEQHLRSLELLCLHAQD